MASISTDIAQQVDITARAFNSFNLQLDITNTNGSILDLTGYKVYFEIRSINNTLLRGLTNDNSSPYSDDGSLYNTSAVSLTEASGIITIAENATNMDFSKGSYKYSLKLESSSGQLKTWMLGKFKINSD
tara:strand:+ start:153 stop:542 length:390 start_codon:yes stop_codon:yes gene_type:complete